MKKKKLCIVCSPGGHFYEIWKLKGWWRKYERIWVTGKSGETDEKLKKEVVYHAYFPESRNVLNATRNLFLAIKILRKEKPDAIFSSGAGVAPPFFWVAWALGIRKIYMEHAGNVATPTLTGILVHPFVDIFLVQNKTTNRFFRKAKYVGGQI